MEATSITRDHLNIVKGYIIDMNKNVVLAFKKLDTIDKNNYEQVEADIMAIVEDNEEKYQLIQGLVLQSFTHAPLGKDLRRSIAYLSISKTLLDMTGNAKNISTYLISERDNAKHNTKWVSEINGKIIRRSQAFGRLINSESATGAKNLIKRDESVNEVYEKLLVNMQSGKAATTKEKKQKAAGFVLTLKNFEQAGDSIKENSEQILFIAQGNVK